MRTLALLLLLLPASAAADLTPKDEQEIRTAIKEQAKTDNRKDTGQIWNEQGPLIYRVRRIEPVTEDVATADADGIRVGPYGERREYTFILTKTKGSWIVARKIPVCPVRSGVQPVIELPQ